MASTIEIAQHHDHHHGHGGEAERAALSRRALRLEYFSLAWNVVEAVVGMIAGLASGSIALLGFALDSVVESSSAAILVWRLRNDDNDTWDREAVERRAIRLVALSFLGLALLVGARAAVDLATGNRPDVSGTGIVLAVVSLVGMPLLALSKRRMATRLHSRSLDADSNQTLLCSYISAFLLAGLAANALWGAWWADPLAGLAIAAIAGREARELWTTERFCTC